MSFSCNILDFTKIGKGCFHPYFPMSLFVSLLYEWIHCISNVEGWRVRTIERSVDFIFPLAAILTDYSIYKFETLLYNLFLM